MTDHIGDEMAVPMTWFVVELDILTRLAIGMEGNPLIPRRDWKEERVDSVDPLIERVLCRFFWYRFLVRRRVHHEIYVKWNWIVSGTSIDDYQKRLLWISVFYHNLEEGLRQMILTWLTIGWYTEQSKCSSCLNTTHSGALISELRQ